MKKLLIVFVVIISAVGFSQFKEQNLFKPSIKDGIVNENPNLILGLINPNNITMKHSYSLSYSSFGNNGLALGVYTNSLYYKLSEQFNIQVDASLIHSPYSSFGKNFQDQISGIYLSKAAINYKPWDNFQVSFQYRNLPIGYSASGFSWFNRASFDDYLWDK